MADNNNEAKPVDSRVALRERGWWSADVFRRSRDQVHQLSESEAVEIYRRGEIWQLFWPWILGNSYLNVTTWYMFVRLKWQDWNIQVSRCSVKERDDDGRRLVEYLGMPNCCPNTGVGAAPAKSNSKMRIHFVSHPLLAGSEKLGRSALTTA